MFEISQTIVENQVLMVITVSIAGLCTTVLVTLHGSNNRWKIADLVWVICGGMAAISAVLASIYISDDSKIVRKVDLIYVMFDRIGADTARLRESQCNDHNYYSATLIFGNEKSVICHALDRLHFALERLHQQPLFDEVSVVSSHQSNSESPLGKSYAESTWAPDAESFAETIRKFESLGFGQTTYSNQNGGIGIENRPLSLVDLENVSFFLNGPGVNSSLEVLKDSGFYSEMIANYSSIRGAFSVLIEQWQDLASAWDANQRNFYFLALRVIALCFVSFAFPLRVGKSIFELRIAKEQA